MENKARILALAKLKFLQNKTLTKMPFVKIYIHFVWSTKNREPLLDSSELRSRVWQHIKENARSKDIFIDTINGYKEHCHCLISLGIDQTTSKVMHLIKGGILLLDQQEPTMQ